MDIVIPILTFLLIGGVSGAVLVAASRVFFVKSDDRVERIIECLPNINCGACGYSGCEGYASAVAENKCPPNLCKPGGAKTAAGIGEVLGITVEAAERETAFVRCNGNCNAVESKYIYNGTPNCLASERYYNGKSGCRKGCLGYGDCVRVCEYGAISIVNGVAVIDEKLCGSCGLCVKTCPNGLIILRRASKKTMVACSSIDTGKITRTVCKNGCIACKICEKKCPEDAIHVRDNHAEINEKCVNCGICVGACPVKCIHVLK